jgi:murein L,D-transpeptidase YafK
MKLPILCTIFLFQMLGLNAQSVFWEQQQSYPKVAKAIKARTDTLKNQFKKAGLVFPPKQLYIRSFKFDSQLEVWVKSGNSNHFQLFKTYPVCALSGTMGPKRMDGDYQVPEGCYFIKSFNPLSNYHLSLELNYPNASDRLLSDSIKPGSDIYIHGGCLTQGCIPIKDIPMEELYVLSAYTQMQGQDFIPVHIFPINYDQEKSREFLKKSSRDDPEYRAFTDKMKEIFNHFQGLHQLPIIGINQRGEYRVF